MKFAKLSIAALAVVGFSSSALALDLSGVTAKPYVKTKLYYETIDKDGANNDLFSQASASGQALLTTGITGALDSCWGYGFEYNIADTLGLENNVVSDTRMGWGLGHNDRILDGRLDTQHWASQAYVAYSPCNTILSNTTFKIGRQFLDTPFAFTEKWNLAPNSFDAIVALNQDIKNVTLVGAYVGKGNGQFARVTNGDRFTSYLDDSFAASGHGTYAVGAMTNLVAGMPINAWYYNVGNVADALWADASYNLKIADDMSAGLGFQFGQMMPDDSAKEDTTGYAAKIGGKVGMFNVMAAYSTVDEAKGGLPLANTATGFKKTKLYTAGIYTDGTGVARPGSDAMKVKASAKVDGIGKFIAQYVTCENDDKAAMHNVDEMDFIYATKLAGIGVKAIYINRDVTEGEKPGAKGFAMDTDHFRMILSKNF
jgi:hypothetical protein